MRLFMVPWPLTCRSLLTFPSQRRCFPKAMHGYMHRERKPVPEINRSSACSALSLSLSLLHSGGFYQVSVTYCFPGCGIPLPVLDLVLYTHPSRPDVCGGRRLPVYDDIIAQPGGAYVQQSPVYRHRRVRTHWKKRKKCLIWMLDWET